MDKPIMDLEFSKCLWCDRPILVDKNRGYNMGDDDKPMILMFGCKICAAKALKKNPQI